MRIQDLARQLGNCKQQLFTRDRQARMAELTIRELDTLKDAVAYKGVGKMCALFVVYTQPTCS
jgi:hypothetical protein